MRVTRGPACLALCGLVFTAGLATAAFEVSNRERGGDLYRQEMQRLQLEQAIEHDATIPNDIPCRGADLFIRILVQRLLHQIDKTSFPLQRC